MLPDAAVTVLGDDQRLGQVFANLISNAIKATSEGGVVSITAGAEGAEAIVRVRDTGIGIPPEMLESIFEPFQQVETPRTRSRVGLGIGLTIARSIVELHRGRVTATSDASGKGSEFTVTLPLSEHGARDAGQPSTPAGRTTPRSVLVVEDDDDVRDTLAELLETMGHAVVAVRDAPAALEAAIREPFDLALIDIGLPGIDGYELARRLRAIPGLRAMLVALSGYSSDQHRQRTDEAGFDDQLVKPAGLAALQRLVESPLTAPR
jgi:CheY-like chemotaxis protein